MPPKNSQRTQRYILQRSLILLLVLTWSIWFWKKDITVILDSAPAPDRPALPTLPSPSHPSKSQEGQNLPIEGTTTKTSLKPANGDLPPEYVTLSEDQQQCEDIYGNSYIKNIAKTSQESCGGKSLSGLHCFYGQRLWNRWVPWKKDPLCLAQGVSFVPSTPAFSPEYRGAEFEMQCEQQNFNQDLMSDYWGDTGVGNTLKTWKFQSQQDTSRCSKQNSTEDWIILVRREVSDQQNIWHQLMQISQARHTIDALQTAVSAETGQPWLSSEDASSVQVVFDDDRHHALEDLWSIVGKGPTRTSDLVPGTCYGNVIVPMPGSSSPFWSALIGNMKQACYRQTLLNTLVDRVFNHYGVEPRSSSDIREDLIITIVNRAENRKLINLDSWVTTLRARYPNFKIDVVDFATISFVDQLRLVQNTDVLVGHHGAAMTHTMFMAPESAVVEVLPPYFLQRGFRSLGRMRGLQYFTAQSMWEEEYNNITRWKDREWAYMLDEDFLGLVDGAVRSQLNRLNNDERSPALRPY
ncbi:hypothetical protein F5883DRAFT_412613 [Diaporthe sp. PMI_573]|nr:hypothetical protein F5883DRAFT_412613 [Diaporthaceae sp. PMI_573]